MINRPKNPARTSLSTRYLATYAIAYLVLIAVFAVVADRIVRSALLDDLTGSLQAEAELAAESLPADEAMQQAWAESMFDLGGFRTTLIAADGTVLADSHSDPAVLENHALRSEVLEAVNGDIGVSTRRSASTGFEQLYLALPARDGLIVRVSVATRVIDQELNAVRYPLLVTAVVLGLLGVTVVWVLARRTARPMEELTGQVRSIAAGSSPIEVGRFPIREVDELGLAIATMADDLSSRTIEAERINDYLDVVLATLPDGTVLFDEQNRITYSNPAASDLLGVVPLELSELAPFQCQAMVREARERGEPVERIVEHGRPVRRLKVMATPFRDDGRLLLTIRDTTNAERLAQVRKDFVANASHELKTPVTTIIASAEALQIALERDHVDAASFALQIETSARQLDHLVADLLDLSRLERDVPEFAPVRLDLLARDELERARGRLADRDLAMDVEVNEVTVAGNHRDLSIAVKNLLDNALRYTAKGSIKVTVTTEDNLAVLSVSDTGSGIPSRDIDRVFERFFRVDSARARATGGTGLGLAIAKHVAESHMGSISVVSELGVGSTFTIRLPLI